MTTIAVLVPTTKGDGINPVDSWAGASSATLRYYLNGRIHLELFSLDQWRGWTFVIDPATLQPQLPRSTTFPQAQ